MKLQSVSDVITNSSSEVFVLYHKDDLQRVPGIIMNYLEGHPDLYSYLTQSEKWEYIHESIRPTTEGIPEFLEYLQDISPEVTEEWLRKVLPEGSEPLAIRLNETLGDICESRDILRDVILGRDQAKLFYLLMDDCL